MRILDYILIGVQIVEFVAIVYIYLQTRKLASRRFELPTDFIKYK